MLSSKYRKKLRVIFIILLLAFIALDVVLLNCCPELLLIKDNYGECFTEGPLHFYAMTYFWVLASLAVFLSLDNLLIHFKCKNVLKIFFWFCILCFLMFIFISTYILVEEQKYLGC